MYEIAVQTEFCAAHTLSIRGEPEPLHGHNWHVTATIAGPRLDNDGLLCDFHAVAHALEALIEPFRNRNLNDVHPFINLNPSAEHVARHLADGLAEKLQKGLAPGAHVAALRVTEATGCAATYRPDNHAAHNTARNDAEET